LDDYCNQVEKQLETTIAQQEKNQQDKERIEKGAKELDDYCNQIEGQLQEQISTLQKLQSEKDSFKKKVYSLFHSLGASIINYFSFPQNIQLQENVEDLQRQLQEEKYRSQHFQFRISELQQELSQRKTIQSNLEKEKLTEQQEAEKELKKSFMEDKSIETKGDETTGHDLMTKTVPYNAILTTELPSPIPGARIGGGGSSNVSTQASPSSVKPFDLERFDPDYRLPAR
jgi:chromosome segregation ATPase